MVDLATARADLKALLSNFPNVYDYRPESITPPGLFIEAQTTYLEPGQSFANWKVYLSVVVIGGKATNAEATRNADSQVAQVIEAVRGEWEVQNVTAGVLDIGGYTYTALVVNITNQL